MADEKAIEADLGPPPWGSRIRELRNRAELTQQQLAEMIGTTKATVSKLERSRRRPSLDWAEKLANALRVDVGALIGMSGRPFIPSVDIIPIIEMSDLADWRNAVQRSTDFMPVVGGKSHMFSFQVDDDAGNVAPDGAWVSVDPTLSAVLVEGALYAILNGGGYPSLHVFKKAPDRLVPDSIVPGRKPIRLGSEPVTVIGTVKSITRFL